MSLYSGVPPIASYSLGPDFRVQYMATHYPNAVHRFFQRWLLGIYWRKL
jgi:hypothetical protein